MNRSTTANADGPGFDDPVGAFCRETHVALEGSGAGTLAGLTFATKDVFHISGHRTGFGSPEWLASHDPATVTASAVRLLLDAGANMVGKTHTDELAYSLTGENVHYGTPVNVRAPGRVPGGSSCGSAAAVAAGLVDFALGTDCGGSVRLPASYCGSLGLRPTVDRVPADGVIPFGPPFDVVGWFARDAGIFEQVGQVLLPDGAGGRPPPRRLLVAADAFDTVSPEVREALAPAVARVAELFADRADVTASEEGLTQWFEVFRVVQAASIWSNLGAWVQQAKPDLGQGIRERFAWASQVSAEDAAAGRARQAAIKAHLDALLGDDGVLCIPASPRPAPLKGTPVDDIEVRYRNQAMHLLCIAGLGGLPQVSLPLAELDGLPLGLSLIGRRGSDEQLLALARTLVPAAG